MTDEELIARLRGWARDIQAGSKAIWAMDQDLKEAADRIEALVNERDKAALWATEQHACADNYALRLGQEKARAERLEAALKWQAEQPEAHPFMVAHALAALKGADHE